MLGKKGTLHTDPTDPPRRRANKRRGRGTYANDRPPIIGTIGRESGQVRLRVVHDTTGATLCAHVHRFTQPGTQLYTDENNGYNHVIRIKGVHKKYLAGYVAMTEFKRNLKRISPDFIAALVTFHTFRC